MTINSAQILAAFQGSLSLNFQILKEIYGCASIELQPDISSPLYLTDDHGKSLSLFLPPDPVIGRVTLVNGNWDAIKQNYIEQIIGVPSQEMTLIDIGTNVGLFTRQCLNKFKFIRNVYCYEPDPSNFRLATRNLGNLRKVGFNNYGLSSESGMFELYLDAYNAGNCTLTKSAIEADFTALRIEVRDAQAESARWVTENTGSFIYKSDTQGFDPIIATSVGLNFWERVKVGVLEIWRLPGKKYDEEKFASILDSFPQKRFEKQPGTNVTSRDVINYLNGTDREQDDLYIWR